MKDNAIRIAGVKAVDYAEKASLHRRERAAGRFDRAVTIPARIDADRVKAEYHDGILALYLPRAEQDKPRDQDFLNAATQDGLTEVAMAKSQELSVQQKKELAPKEEKTVPAATMSPMPTFTKRTRR